MKKSFLFLLVLAFVININAQELQTIKLVEPSTKGGSTIMEALSNRKSVREFSNKKLSDQDLADVVWAAGGINRKEAGLRTSPSWRNFQDVDIYVCFKEGVYLYNAKAHALEPVMKGNFYPMIVSGQDFVNDAPIVLLLVSDFDKITGDGSSPVYISGLNAGIISQNISLFCAGKNMATVPRGFMDKEALKKAFNLKENQHILLNHPVGYLK